MARSQPAFNFANRNIILLVIAGLAVLAAFSPVQESQEVLAPRAEDAKYFFGDTRSVGQEFMAPAGLSGLEITIGKTELAQGELLLHIRTEYFGEDIRTGFSFKPLLSPQKLMWVLEAPESPNKSYWVYRETDSNAFPEGQAFVKGTPIAGNFAFTLKSQRPLFMKILEDAKNSFHPWHIAALVVGLGAAFSTYVQSIRWKTSCIIWGLIVVSVAGHMWLAGRFPGVIDEGAYLQDALQSRWDFLPFRDFLTKGPLYIVFLKIWQLCVPNSLNALRGLSALSWAFAIWLTAKLAREWGLPPKGQIGSALLLAVLPGVLTLTTPLLLQVTSTPFLLAGLLLCLLSVKRKDLRLAIFAGVVLALAYFVRSSSVVGFVIGGIILLRSWRLLSAYVGAIVISLGLIFLASVSFMGLSKTAVMFNLEAFLISQDRLEQAANFPEPLIRRIVLHSSVLWRSAPWLLAGFLLIPIVRLQKYSRWLQVTVALALSLVFYIGLFHVRDAGYGWPIIAIGLPILYLTRQFLVREKTETPANVNFVFANLLWLALLWILYDKWGSFRDSYLVEFLPPLALLAGWVVTQVKLSKLAWSAVVGLFAGSLVTGHVSTMQHPHTGTIQLDELRQFVAIVKREVLESEEIFTAQPIVTALSQRSIALGYSHPGWFLSERAGELNSSLRSIYFLDQAALTKHFEKKINFVVTDPRTDEVYFADPDRQEILAEQFELISEIKGASSGEPFRLYRRKIQM